MSAPHPPGFYRIAFPNPPGLHALGRNGYLLATAIDVSDHCESFEAVSLEPITRRGQVARCSIPVHPAALPDLIAALQEIQKRLDDPARALFGWEFARAAGHTCPACRATDTLRHTGAAHPPNDPSGATMPTRCDACGAAFDTFHRVCGYEGHTARPPRTRPEAYANFPGPCPYCGGKDTTYGPVSGNPPCASRPRHCRDCDASWTDRLAPSRYLDLGRGPQP